MGGPALTPEMLRNPTLFFLYREFWPDELLYFLVPGSVGDLLNSCFARTFVFLVLGGVGDLLNFCTAASS